MNREIVEQWIADLESGKFKPCKNYLVQKVAGETTYCPIGVLGKQLEDRGIILEMYPASPEVYSFVSELGKEANPIFDYDGDEYTVNLSRAIWNMNDNGDANFTEIAQYLRDKILPGV